MEIVFVVRHSNRQSTSVGAIFALDRAGVDHQSSREGTDRLRCPPRPPPGQGPEGAMARGGGQGREIISRL